MPPWAYRTPAPPPGKPQTARAARDRAITSAAATATQPVFAGHGPSRVLALRPPSAKSVRESVAAPAREAGQRDAGTTPHRCRARFAAHVVEEAGDPAAVQGLPGHESPDTARRYVPAAGRRVRALHDKAFATVGGNPGRRFGV